MPDFWRLSSSAMEFFPWDATWLLRWFGDKPINHSLQTAAKLAGIDAETPSWRSSRKGIYLRVEPVVQDHPWLTEDIQLRLEMAAARWKAAEELGRRLLPRMPEEMQRSFALTLRDTGQIRRRAASLGFHLRETNLARLMRTNQARPEAFERARRELLDVLRADKANHAEEKAEAPISPSGIPLAEWPEIDAAIELLQRDPVKFLANYLK
jgi:hypothetical protein